MKIGELARRADVNVQTIRFYEREGLMPCPERLPSGYRCYGAAELRQLMTIKRLKAIGFTLDDVRELTRLSQQATASDLPPGDRTVVQERIRSRAEARLTALDHSLVRLQTMRSSLARVVEGLTGAPVLDADNAALLL